MPWRDAVVTGGGTTRNMITHPRCEVVACCDPDKNQMASWLKSMTGGTGAGKRISAQQFQDYREMLGKMGDKIDAVAVSTPDHNHRPVTMEAMKQGKHVYTQKPLTHRIRHARELRDAAKKAGIVHRMGIQLHSSIANRTVVHFVRNGTIGKIRQVCTWSNKNWGSNSTRRSPARPAPEHLDWPLWLGNAPEQLYRNGIHPKQWRRFIDFGVGTLGDMGVHIFDTPFKALDLAAPLWVRTTCREPNGFSHPTSNTVEYGFRETEYTTKDFQWFWHDGSGCQRKVLARVELPKGRRLPKQGALYVGEKGIMVHPHMSGPVFYPPAIRQTVKKPDLEPMDHFHDWIDACLAGKPSAHADFNYSALLTETVLLGLVGNRFPGDKLEWDGEKGRFRNRPEADRLA